MSTTVSERKAQQMIDRVLSAFPDWGGEGPAILRDFNRDGDCLLMWEEGPYEWPIIFCEVNAGYSYKVWESGHVIPALKGAPVAGVFVEPQNHYSLALYVA